jgi:large subunit ribosomal protein L18
MKTKIKDPKKHNRHRRHMHIRHHVVGTTERPRVAVFRSSKHIYAQIIDDTRGVTLASVSSLKLGKPAAAPAAGADEAAGAAAGKKKKGGKKKPAAGGKVLTAREVGRLLAVVAREKGIKKISFDRGGHLYHGRVAALAEAARENGLEF